MTIFPCCRCGEVPEVSVYPETNILTMAVIRHECSNGRRYFQHFRDIDEAEAINGVIYRWNEAEAGNNPAWWPERYDYLHSVWKKSRREIEK